MRNTRNCSGEHTERHERSRCSCLLRVFLKSRSFLPSSDAVHFNPGNLRVCPPHSWSQGSWGSLQQGLHQKVKHSPRPISSGCRDCLVEIDNYSPLREVGNEFFSSPGSPLKNRSGNCSPPAKTPIMRVSAFGNLVGQVL